MKDGPDNTNGEEHDTETIREDHLTVAPDHSVPEDVEWTQVVQQPVSEGKFKGLTTTIISAVAAAEGVDPMDISHPPLYEVLDTAALETAFFPSEVRATVQDGDAATEFMYRGYRIVIQRDGWVRVYKRSDAEPVAETRQ